MLSHPLQDAIHHQNFSTSTLLFHEVSITIVYHSIKRFQVHLFYNFLHIQSYFTSFHNIISLAILFSTFLFLCQRDAFSSLFAEKIFLLMCSSKAGKPRNIYILTILSVLWELVLSGHFMFVIAPFLNYPLP